MRPGGGGVGTGEKLGGTDDGEIGRGYGEMRPACGDIGPRNSRVGRRGAGSDLRRGERGRDL